MSMSTRNYTTHFARRKRKTTNRLVRAAVHCAEAALLIEDENFANPAKHIHLAKFVELLRHLNLELRDLGSTTEVTRRLPELRTV